MEIGTLGKFPWIYGDLPRGGGESGKNSSKRTTVAAVKGL
jgi:hypothetical protein